MSVFGQHNTIGFIGAGAVGGTLAVALGQAGYRVVAVASRTFASAHRLAQRLVGCTAYAAPQQVVDACELVFISTPDDAIGQVAAGLTWRAGQRVVHCSGATSLDVFAVPLAQGVLRDELEMAMGMCGRPHHREHRPQPARRCVTTALGIAADTRARFLPCSLPSHQAKRKRTRLPLPPLRHRGRKRGAITTDAKGRYVVCKPLAPLCLSLSPSSLLLAWVHLNLINPPPASQACRDVRQSHSRLILHFRGLGKNSLGVASCSPDCRRRLAI